jgi:hypothetical protein
LVFCHIFEKSLLSTNLFGGGIITHLKINGAYMNTLKQIGMGLALISTLAMTGCGGSSSSSNDGGGGGTTEEGTFVDAPVMGLHYKTDTQDGYTDAKGTFKYNIGEKVEFSLGNLSLGKVEAGAMITPYTLAGVEDASDEEKAGSDHATNIALL